MRGKSAIIIGVVMLLTCLSLVVADEYSRDPDVSGLVFTSKYIEESDHTFIEVYLEGTIYIEGNVTDEILEGNSYDFWLKDGYAYRWNDVTV